MTMYFCTGCEEEKDDGLSEIETRGREKKFKNEVGPDGVYLCPLCASDFIQFSYGIGIPSNDL